MEFKKVQAADPAFDLVGFVHFEKSPDDPSQSFSRWFKCEDDIVSLRKKNRDLILKETENGRNVFGYAK